DNVEIWSRDQDHDFDVDLTYVSGSPVPPSGGNVYYDLFVEYLGQDPIDYDAWIDIEYEGGEPFTVALRSFANYQPGWTINRPGMFFPVPNAYAAGNYEIFVRVGDHPDSVWTADSFPFEKSGVSDGTAFIPFAVDGTPNPFDDIITLGGNISQPESHALFTAYPNPFNPSTTITFNLDAAAHTRLSIYDIQGRLLTTLVDGFRDAGIHEATFGATNFASGIYFARIEAGNRSVMQKLILVK
ncbi:MAG: T9SS type A sorting domain-containing protein, partial [bacterium]